MLFTGQRVKVSDSEISMILRTCLTDPGDWEQVVLNIKANIENLPESTRQMYLEKPLGKLKSRCRDKYSLLLKGKHEVQDPELV